MQNGQRQADIMAYLAQRGEQARRHGQVFYRTLRGVASRRLQRLPSTCPLCLDCARGGGLCPDCHADVLASRRGTCLCARCGLTGFTTEDCPDCLALNPIFERVVVGFDYVSPGNELIQQFKQQRRFQHARLLAGVVAPDVRKITDWPESACLVPVPAHPVALRQRGFSPAAELARHLRPYTGLPVRLDVLVHQVGALARPPQKHLTRHLRLQALSQVFCCVRPLHGAGVVLVDDVMTTGATLQAAAQVLREGGAGTIWCVVAARTPFPVRLMR